MPNNIECPINDIRFSNSPDPNSVKDEYKDNYYYNYTTTQFYDGIYLHYSNENIFSNIITDIDFKLVELQYSHYEYYNQINFTSNRIIEEKYTLYLILKDYIGSNDLNAFLNYGKKLSFDIASLILLFQSLVTLFIDNIKEGDPPIFHIITTISLYIQLVFQIIINVYYTDIQNLDSTIFFYYDIDESKYLNNDVKYYNILLSFLVTIITLYLFLTNHRKNDNNSYYYLAYCLYLIFYFFDKCGHCCKERVERNKERNRKIISDLEYDIYKFDYKISELEKEKRDLIDKNEKTLEEIANKSNILNDMKDEKNSFWNMNEEEEIKFEQKFKQLKKDNEFNIRKFENLKNQIKKIENEINYYKMIEFKQELNNK